MKQKWGAAASGLIYLDLFLKHFRFKITAERRTNFIFLVVKNNSKYLAFELLNIEINICDSFKFLNMSL